MLCKDCEAGHLVEINRHGFIRKVLLCLVDDPVEVINIKFWEDEEGCVGI